MHTNFCRHELRTVQFSKWHFFKKCQIACGGGTPTFMGCTEERVQLLKETEEGKKLRSRIGGECCPRKERNF